MNITITNWKDLVDQFGLTDKKVGCPSARQLSNELKKLVENIGTVEYQTIPCNTQSDAIAIFQLVSRSNTMCGYEYQGTAN